MKVWNFEVLGSDFHWRRWTSSGVFIIIMCIKFCVSPHVDVGWISVFCSRKKHNTQCCLCLCLFLSLAGAVKQCYLSFSLALWVGGILCPVLTVPRMREMPNCKKNNIYIYMNYWNINFVLLIKLSLEYVHWI